MARPVAPVDERRRALAEERRQRRLERRSVREPILQREDDEAQLGHRAALGLQVDRLGVEQRAADRDHDQAPRRTCEPCWFHSDS